MMTKTFLGTAALAVMLGGSSALAQAPISLGHLADYSGATSDVAERRISVGAAFSSSGPKKIEHPVVAKANARSRGATPRADGRQSRRRGARCVSACSIGSLCMVGTENIGM